MVSTKVSCPTQAHAATPEVGNALQETGKAVAPLRTNLLVSQAPGSCGHARSGERIGFHKGSLPNPGSCGHARSGDQPTGQLLVSQGSLPSPWLMRPGQKWGAHWFPQRFPGLSNPICVRPSAMRWARLASFPATAQFSKTSHCRGPGWGGALPWWAEEAEGALCVHALCTCGLAVSGRFPHFSPPGSFWPAAIGFHLRLGPKGPNRGFLLPAAQDLASSHRIPLRAAPEVP